MATTFHKSAKARYAAYLADDVNWQRLRHI